MFSLLKHYVTVILTFDPLTLNVHILLVVKRSNSVLNMSEIEQSALEL